MKFLPFLGGSTPAVQRGSIPLQQSRERRPSGSRACCTRCGTRTIPITPRASCIGCGGPRISARVLPHAGDYACAEAESARAPRLRRTRPSPTLRYFRARIYERSGRIDEAVEISNKRASAAGIQHYLEGHSAALAVRPAGCGGRCAERSERSSSGEGAVAGSGLGSAGGRRFAVSATGRSQQRRRAATDVAARTNGAGAKPLGPRACAPPGGRPGAITSSNSCARFCRLPS